MFLRVCQFVNPRRERFRGQDVLVFDFEPNPEYKPKNMEERVVKELAGVVWVDEKAHDVVRLEAYFVGDVHIGGRAAGESAEGHKFRILEQAIYQQRGVAAHLRRSARGCAGLAGEGVQGKCGDEVFGLQTV